MTPESSRPLTPIVTSLRTLVSRGRRLARHAGDLVRIASALPIDWRALLRGPGEDRTDDAHTLELRRRAGEARAAGRVDEAVRLYQDARARAPHDVAMLRALRDLLIELARWREALDVQQSLAIAVPGAERSVELSMLAAVHYELGREALGAGRFTDATAAFRHALRADRGFVPAAVALGDAHDAAGDPREAVRVWERAVEMPGSLPILARLERVYRLAGRPSRMIALYRAASERSPDDIAVAVALGRVYLELEMLDEAADHFEKIEVRAPDAPAVHAYLGVVFERRGDIPEAFEEYRKALRLADAFSWPHRCTACETTVPTWQDRCPRCRRWNVIAARPVS
jgi:tetratricopeptide (TPR) repeat protein